MTKQQLLEIILRLPNDMKCVIMSDVDGVGSKFISDISLDRCYDPISELVWFEHELVESTVDKDEIERIKSLPKVIVLS